MCESTSWRATALYILWCDSIETACYDCFPLNTFVVNSVNKDNKSKHLHKSLRHYLQDGPTIPVVTEYMRFRYDTIRKKRLTLTKKPSDQLNLAQSRSQKNKKAMLSQGNRAMPL